MCDRGNHVEFSSNQFLVTNVKSSNVVLGGKRQKNVYKVCVVSLSQNLLTCLSALDDDIMLWHKRLHHASLSLLNKLISKDLVVGLRSIKFNDDKVCDACASLCGPMKVTSRGGKRYVLVIVDNYSHFTWILF